MKNIALVLSLSILATLFLKCSSNPETETEEKKDFDLIVYETPEEEIKEFKVSNILPYFDNGKWGYANKKGEIVIPCKYNSCGFFSDGMAWVEKAWKFGYIDTLGKLVIDHQYLAVENFNQGIAVVKNNKYKGLIDKNNNVLIPFEYEDLQINTDNLICFKQNNQWGLITVEGKQIINPIYDYSFFFENGFAVVKRNRKYGIVNKTGEEVVICKYDKVTPTRNKGFIVTIEKSYNEKLFGLVDSTGKVIIPITYKEISEAINNTLIVSSDDGKAVFNHQKDTIINFIYSDIRAGNTNLLAVTSMGKWGFINLKGDTIIPFQFWDAQGFLNNHTIAKKEAYGMIDAKGEMKVPFEFDKVVYADMGIVQVFKNEKYGFYSIEGKKLTDCIYDDIDYSLDGYETFIRHQDPNFDESNFGKFINNYAVIGIKGRLGAINKKGKEVIKPFFHKLSPFDEKGIAKANYMHKNGLVNNKGKRITEIMYEDISHDETSGYYYLNVRTEGENNRKNINFGYFDLDGTLYSNSKKGIKKVESEEDIILEIRTEYQNIIKELKTASKGKTVKIDENTTATLRANRLIVADKKQQLSYEYYYNNKLNLEGPFFILKKDKSSGEAKYDRYYYKNGKIMRWVDKLGKHQVVANGPYAPEHIEFFKARFFFTAYENQLVISNSPNNQEVEKIRKWVAEISKAISEGKYKKGDVFESWEGSGGGGHEEYVDEKGLLIYKYSHEGSDYFSSSDKEYFKNGKLIYSTSEGSGTMNLMGAGNYTSGEVHSSSSETFYFSDGSIREYQTKEADGGSILSIREK